MKAISLHQPWASLIAEGIKTIETRSWAPPKALIGQRIAIHAAKKMMPWPYNPEKYPDVPELQALAAVGTPPIPLGDVVATAVLADAWQVDHDSLPVVQRNGHPMVYQKLKLDGTTRKFAAADPYGDFEPGRWLWFLEDIKKLDPPVPAIGHQGFWSWIPRCPDTYAPKK